jgi:hypothetical protein
MSTDIPCAFYMILFVARGKTISCRFVEIKHKFESIIIIGKEITSNNYQNRYMFYAMPSFVRQLIHYV